MLGNVQVVSEAGQLAALLSLLTDPKVTQAKLDELKAASKTYSELLEQHKESSVALDKQTAEVFGRETAVTAREVAVDEATKNVTDRENAHRSALSVFSAVNETAKVGLAAQGQALSQKEDDLAAREQAVAAAEADVASRSGALAVAEALHAAKAQKLAAALA